ncbi:MAG: hypothetical protein V7K53_16465 [Nostoc sp.]
MDAKWVIKPDIPQAAGRICGECLGFGWGSSKSSRNCWQIQPTNSLGFES